MSVVAYQYEHSACEYDNADEGLGQVEVGRRTHLAQHAVSEE
jgi:hypothetical protein